MAHQVIASSGIVQVILMAILVLSAMALLASPTAAADTTKVDGEISPGEYAFSVELAEDHFWLHWTIEGDVIQIGLEAKARGMVAIGWEPTKRMMDADMIIGYREGSTFSLHDTISVGEIGPHPDDVAEGGTYDIMIYEVREVGGVTTIEFTRNLTTGDDQDNPIDPEGKVKFLWATSDTDDFATYHSRRGTAVIDMKTGEFETIEYPTLWPYHAFFMGAATISFVLTWFTVVYKKRLKKKFLDHHHTVGSIGVLFAIIGLVLGIYMVGQLDSGHIRVTHSLLATITLVLSIVTLAVGQVFMSKKHLKRKTRKPHIYLGGASIIMMAITSLAGLVYVFPV